MGIKVKKTGETGDWKAVPFGDFATLQRGIDLPTSKREDGSTPILGSFGITGYHSEARVNGPGVTVGRSGGSMGTVVYSDIDFWPLNTTLYVKDFHGNNPKFVYYFMRGFDFTRFNSGSAQQSLNRNFIHPVEILVPPLETQKSIAHILGALDEKIELNRQMSATLEAIVQAVFKSWFVDFDPVRTIMEGKQPEGMDAETASLFPGKLIDSADGLIPEGWDITLLKSLTTKISKGTTPSKKQIAAAKDKPNVPFLKVNNISDDGLIDWDSLIHIPHSIHVDKLKRSILKPGDVLISIAGTIGRIAVVPDSIKILNTNQAVAFIRPKKIIYTQYIKSFLNDCSAKSQLQSKVVQAVQANVSLKSVSELKICVPPEEVVNKWACSVKDLIRRKQDLEANTKSLTTIRDSLLPKLVSGKISIAKISQRLESVL